MGQAAIAHWHCTGDSGTWALGRCDTYIHTTTTQPHAPLGVYPDHFEHIPHDALDLVGRHLAVEQLVVRDAHLVLVATLLERAEVSEGLERLLRIRQPHLDARGACGRVSRLARQLRALLLHRRLVAPGQSLGCLGRRQRALLLLHVRRELILGRVERLLVLGGLLLQQDVLRFDLRGGGEGELRRERDSRQRGELASLGTTVFRMPFSLCAAFERRRSIHLPFCNPFTFAAAAFFIAVAASSAAACATRASSASPVAVSSSITRLPLVRRSAASLASSSSTEAVRLTTRFARLPELDDFIFERMVPSRL